MYSREGLDSKGIISDLQGPVLMTPSTAQNAEYFTTVVNFDYRIHPNWNLYLKVGGKESSTLKEISETLGKETIDTNTFGKSTGRSGNYSTNYQISGRELLTPDEVRMLDNQYAILFIRGERPIMDFKYDIMKHPNVALTTDGKASPYKHGEVTKDIASIAIWDIDPATLPEKEMEETNWELLSDEEMEALFINNQTN